MRDLKGSEQAAAEQFVWRKPGDVFSVQSHVPGCRTVMSGDHVKQGGLSGAVGTDEAGD